MRFSDVYKDQKAILSAGCPLFGRSLLVKVKEVDNKMDRERAIQEIVSVLTTLEKCSDRDIENVKSFLRYMSDDALYDMELKHKEAMRMAMAGASRQN